jgi:N-acetylneuraminic acid mutarotase
MRLANLLLGVLLLASCDATGPDDGSQPVVAQPAVPTGIVLLNGSEQVAEVGTHLTLSVRVTTERGAPAAGVTVLWGVSEGNGSITPTNSQTGTNGVASAELVVGSGASRVTARVPGKDISASYNVQGCGSCGAWEVVTASQEGRAWAATAVVGNDVWLIGGEVSQNSSDSVTVFMPANRSWRRGIVPIPRATIASVALALGSRIYFIGGSPWDLFYFIRGERTVYSHDPGSSVWHDRAPLTVGRFFAAGAALNGKLYVLGGHSYCYYWGWCIDGALSSMEVYDPAIDRWVAGPPMKFRRSMAGAAALDGKLYVAGGVNDDNFWKGAFVSSLEMFDPGTQMWVAKKDMPVGGPIQLVAMNGKLYALQTAQMDGYASRMYVYDPAEDTWSRLRDVPASLFGPAAAVVDGRMYVIGGYANASDRPYLRPLSQAVYVLRH